MAENYEKKIDRLETEVELLKAKDRRLREHVERQKRIRAIWFTPTLITEQYLQDALKKLYEDIEEGNK